MTKFLILGGGSTLANFFSKEYKKESILISKKECDVTDLKQLEKVFKKYNFKYVLNTAAITDIKYCETNSEGCFNVNTLAIQSLSKLCEKYNKKLIHISSDYAVHTTNIYGYSKFLSERILDQKKDLVIRTSFYSPKYFIIKSLLTGNKTPCYKNMYFNPVSINRLIGEIYKNKEKVGLINIFSEKKISKYDFGKMFANVFDIDQNLVKPENFIQKPNEVILPLNSFVKSDIKIKLDEDLGNFRLS